MELWVVSPFLCGRCDFYSTKAKTLSIKTFSRHQVQLKRVDSIGARGIALAHYCIWTCRCVRADVFD